MNDLIVIEDDAAPALPVIVGEQEIAACNYLAEGVRGHMQKAWQMAVALGFRLSLLKAKCEHGEWGKLFASSNSPRGANLLTISQRQADKYMQLFHACEARARQLEQSEGMLELLAYTTGVVAAEAGVVDIQAKAEELSGMLTGMAPYAESMSQALFSFMYPEETAEPEAAQDFFRGARNKKGRLKKGRELSAEEVVERKKAENWEALNKSLAEVQATLAAGRHLLLPQGCRGQAISIAQEILSKLMQTNEN